ncbi:hypothetical protein D9M70_463120 [compost metagenome]
MKDVDALAALGASFITKHDAFGGKNAVAEEQDVLGCQSQRRIEADRLEKAAPDHHAGEMQEAPVSEHHIDKVRNFDDERRFLQSNDAVAFRQFGNIEMVVERLAACDRRPIAVGAEAAHASIGILQMIRGPFVVRIEECHELGIVGNMVQSGVARAARSLVGLAYHGQSRSFLLT